MRWQLVLAALVGGVVGFGATESWANGSSSHRSWREDWYRAYERYREAKDRLWEVSERRRERLERRAYEFSEDCDCYGIGGGDYYPRRYRRYHHHHRHWRHHGYRYRHYVYDYGYRWRYYHHGYGPYLNAPYYKFDTFEPSGREWRAEDHPTGGKTWWNRIDREGRGGQQE